MCSTISSNGTMMIYVNNRRPSASKLHHNKSIWYVGKKCVRLLTHWAFHSFDWRSKFAGEGIKYTLAQNRITDMCLYIADTVFIRALCLTLMKRFLEFKLLFSFSHLRAHVTLWSVESHAARARMQRINKGWYEGNPNVTSWLYPVKG